MSVSASLGLRSGDWPSRVDAVRSHPATGEGWNYSVAGAAIAPFVVSVGPVAQLCWLISGRQLPRPGHGLVPHLTGGLHLRCPNEQHCVLLRQLRGDVAELLLPDRLSQRGEHSPSSMCLVVDVPLAATQAVLDRCNRGDIEVVYDLLVPDTSGAGIWVLSTDAGTRYSGVEPSKGLVAIAGAAQSIFGD